MIPTYKNAQELLEYSKHHEVQIIENSDKMLVLTDVANGVRAHAYHQAADNHGMGATAPCLVIRGERELMIYAPRAKAERVRVSVYDELEISECPEELDVDIRDGRTEFNFTTSESEEKAFYVKYITITSDMFYRVSYTKEHERRFAQLSKEGLASVFLHCKTAMVGGKTVPLSPDNPRLQTVMKNGVMLAPVSFFEQYYGIDRLSPDTFVDVAGTTYVPIIETARAIGLSALPLYEDRLIVIGSSEQVEEVGADENLVEAGAYATFGKYDASDITHEDYEEAKRRWRIRLVGSPELNDLELETVKKKVAWYDYQCDKAYSTLNRSPDRVILWGEAAPKETEELWTQYQRIEALALSYATYGSKYYQNPDVLRDILTSLEWMYENMYGEAEIAGTGWRNVHLFNWWHWFSGAADCLTNAMLMVEDHLTMEKKRAYLKCYLWLRTVMYADLKNRSGAITRIAPSTKAALLLEDATLLEECQRDFDSVVGAEEYGLSLHKADYVNWTHSMPHNISYGVGHLHRALFVSSVLAQTPLDFNGPKRYNMFNLVRYCFEPAMYRSQGFVMFSGRSTFAIELYYGASILAKTIPMIGCFGEEEDAYIKRFIKRHAASAEVQERVKAECSIYDCATLNSILNDDTIPSDNSSYEIGYAWFTGDRAAQHRKDYAVGIAMSSRREKAYECINSANKSGWYTGNGATYLYTNYDTHQYDGKNFITNNIDVAYHFPGTTEDSRPRVLRSIRNNYEWYPDNTFAGGVQIGGKYVVAAMDYISMNNEVDEYPDDYGYGGSQPIHLNDLRARKAWFCFDDEIVCLGAGITSTMSSPVNTTAEHRRIVNAEGDKQYMNGEALPTCEYEKRYTGRPYFNMEGHAGYVFLEDTDVYLRRYVCEEAAGQSFIELRAEHGENPTDKTYAYAVLPYATNEVLSEYRDNPDVKIISNTAKCQAVKDASSGVYGYVFYEAGECDGIEVSGPCIVTKHREGNEWVLGVCDATQKQRTLTVALNERITVTDKNAKITVSEKDGKTLLTVNVFVAHGRRFEIKYN